MKAILVVAALVAVALARPHNQHIQANTTQMSWGEFKAQFGKTYETTVEEVKRAAIYAENVKLIESMNTQGLTYTVGVNQFADLTKFVFVPR